ncbi:hypothetical protein [Galbitalea soli]|uniref:Uncharacterized protein n=1 Tax=Galbitalea soli TaxID=1268042 RepID=A0A7C9PN50_9MICO|nr:hypothetical protein [Galbitalea soli]NEM91392.1 hypothetical protein [Galbitalea soli]NYJ30084.1 hypothetical protein [Galbitalea soli]
MSNRNDARQAQGLWNMIHPRLLVAQLREAYGPRFGQGFTNRLVGGAVILVISGWVMVVGVVGLITGGIVTFSATGSLSDVYTVASFGFGLIVIGFVVNAVGVGIRTTAIKRMSDRIRHFDPKVTVDGAGRLIKSPQLYDRWMSQHPGFISH